MICWSFIFSMGFATCDCDLKFYIYNFTFYLYFLSYFSLNSSCSYIRFSDSKFSFYNKLALFVPLLEEFLFYSSVISYSWVNFFYKDLRPCRKSSLAFFYVSNSTFCNSSSLIYLNLSNSFYIYFAIWESFYLCNWLSLILYSSTFYSISNFFIYFMTSN